MHRSAIAAIALVLFSSGAAFAQDDALSTVERKALSAKAADRQVRRDIESLLKPAGKFENGMFVVLRGTSLETLPYATAYPGLCEQDMLGVDYTPDATDGQAIDANTPLRPYRLRLFQSFTLDARRFHPTPLTMRPRQSDEACTSEGKSDRFSAPDEDAAVMGYTALQGLAARLRAGSLVLPPCDAEKGTSCAQTVLEVATPGHLDQIETCPAALGARCFRIDADGSVGVTIIVATPEGAIGPENISSAKVETYIIVT